MVQTPPSYSPSLPILHDILFLGAGPSSLALAARLRESTPSALFTDVEHTRYHWMSRHGSRVTRLSPKSKSKPNPLPSTSTLNILALDAASPTWLGVWNKLFATFEIPYLRSPLFFHPSPADADDLLSYAYTHRRGAELEKDIVEIQGVVGKELSKHEAKKRRVREGRRNKTNRGCSNEGRYSTLPAAPAEIDERDRKDYFVPSTALFREFIDVGIVGRYRLSEAGTVVKGRCSKMEYFPCLADGVAEFCGLIEVDCVGGFVVTTEDGRRLFAKTVVMGIGAGGVASIPREIEGVGSDAGQGACHTVQLMEREFFTGVVKGRVADRKRSVTVVVVGGGLTSAQIVDMAVKKGVDKVILLMRGPLKVKPFDVTLPWIGKYKNLQKAIFWTADTDTERLEMISEARNGGSITPPYKKILATLIKAGKVQLLEHTRIISKSWSSTATNWGNITLERRAPSSRVSPETGSSPAISIETIRLTSIDYIYYATGITPDISSLPFLGPIRQQFPIETIGGFPVLTNDLQWREDVPLFVLGRLASLRLGPGAGNLIGAREGAERVAWRMEELVEKGFFSSSNSSSCRGNRAELVPELLTDDENEEDAEMETEIDTLDPALDCEICKLATRNVSADDPGYGSASEDQKVGKNLKTPRKVKEQEKPNGDAHKSYASGQGNWYDALSGLREYGENEGELGSEVE